MQISEQDVKVSLKHIVDFLPIHVYWLDLNMVFLGCNITQAKTVGLSSPDEIIGKSVYDVQTKENAASIIKNNKLVLKTKKTILFEEELFLPDGSKGTYLSEKSPLFDQRGNVIGLLGVSFDITAKKQLDETKNILLENFIAHLPGNAYWKNRKGVYLGCNNNILRNFKLSSSQKIIGKTIEEIFSEYPEVAKKITNDDEEIMKTGKPKFYEETGINHKGEPAIYLTSKVPLMTSQKEVIGLLGMSFDITEEKKTAENNAILLENIISNLPGNVFWKNREGIYLGCNENQAKMLKLSSSKKIIGKTLPDLLPDAPDVAKKVAEYDEKIMASGQVNSYEEVGINQNREPATYLTSKVPLKNAQKKVVGLLGLSFDISKQKQAEIAKNDFISNMAHDVRTPLTGIIGMAKTIAQNPGSKKITDYAETIAKSSQQLLALLNSILEDVTHGTKNPALVQKTFHLNNIFQNLDAFFSATLSTKKISLEFKEETSIPQVLEGNAEALHRVLLNLLGNAIKFTHQGKVTLSAKKITPPHTSGKKVYIEFKIIDTGIGMEQDKINLIFEPFTRLNDASQGLYEGSGLGLHATKKTVEALGGSIDVSSTIRKGSTFTVVLPFQKSKTTLKALQESEPRLTPLSPELPPLSANILLVEDNAIVADVLVLQFEHLGCKMTIAHSGKEAFRQFKNHTFDLVYTDIGLPDIKGHKLAEMFRQWEKETKRKKTPIIALSAHAGEDVKKLCLAAGIDAVLNKPVPDEILYQQITTFMGTPLKNLSALSSLIKKSDIDHSPQECNTVIDLNLGAKLSSGNLVLAKEMISLLRKETLKHFPSIQTYYVEENWHKLHEKTHHFYGATCFCGTPRLTSAAKELEFILSSYPSQHQDIKKIKASYKAFEKEVKRFLVESRDY